MTTLETLTDKQIVALSDEAATAGDLEMVQICDRALTGDVDARRAVVDAINYAEAQR
jgi:hypothetical protein